LTPNGEDGANPDPIDPAHV
ncbi:unnamed protein product, partial [Rotaria sp. Silwood1]